jgi:RsiW-degrading membrane proteinase PrsW (M82 family)
MEKLKLKDLYTYHLESNKYVLEIDIDQYQDMFNTWDAAPLKRKDIEPDLMDYLETAGRDIPLKYDLIISFIMPEAARDEKKEVMAKDALSMQFRYAISQVNASLTFNYRRILTFLIMSLIFLFINYLLRDALLNQALTIALEGLLVGGWFLLWNVFSIFILDNSVLNKRKRVLARYVKTDVVFTSKKVST